VTATRIDLNADLGEGEPHDALLLDIVSSCNIACGGHVGDDASIRRTVTLAAERGVAVGAHPSYPDRQGFGRRSGFLKGPALNASLAEQMDRIAAVCASLEVPLVTLKPHGALYNDAAKNAALATMLVDVAGRFDCTLVGLPNAATEGAARREGLAYRREGFVDRGYRADGSLAPRGTEGAMIEDTAAAAEQALRLARGTPITATDGTPLALPVETLCLHGDTPNAERIAHAVRQRFADAGIVVEAPNRG